MSHPLSDYETTCRHQSLYIDQPLVGTHEHCFYHTTTLMNDRARHYYHCNTKSNCFSFSSCTTCTWK